MDAFRHLSIRRKLARLLLPAAALLPFVLSLVFHSVEASPQPVAGGEVRPALAFEQYMVNLGPVEPRKYIPARFTFTNVGEQPVKITGVRASCGCLNPRLEKHEYAPNESGTFYVRVETPNEAPGPKEYLIHIAYEDPQPRQETLTFKVVLPERQVTVSPRALIFYQRGTQETRQEIAVTDYRTRPLSVLAAECRSSFVRAELGETGTDDEGNHQTRIVVTVADRVPADSHQVLLRLRTDDPEYDPLHVPLLIHGQ